MHKIKQICNQICKCNNEQIKKIKHWCWDRRVTNPWRSVSTSPHLKIAPSSVHAKMCEWTGCSNWCFSHQGMCVGTCLSLPCKRLPISSWWPSWKKKERKVTQSKDRKQIKQGLVNAKNKGLNYMVATTCKWENSRSKWHINSAKVATMEERV